MESDKSGRMLLPWLNCKDCEFHLSWLSSLGLIHLRFDEANCHVGEAHVARNWGHPLANSWPGSEALHLTMSQEPKSANKNASLEGDPFMANNNCMVISHSAYSCTCCCIFWLFLLRAVNRAAMNTDVQLCVWTPIFNSYEYIPRSEIAGS